MSERPDAGPDAGLDGAEPVTRHLRHVARGGAAGLLGSAVSAVGGIGLVVVLARGVAPAEAGRFLVATSVFLIAAAVLGAGTSTGLARFVLRWEAEGRDRDLRRLLLVAAAPVLAASVVTAAAAVALAGPLAGALGWAEGEAVVVVLAAGLPWAVATEVALGATRAWGRMGPTVWLDRVLRTVVQTAGAALALGLGGGLLGAALAWTAGWVLVGAGSALSLRRWVRRQVPARAVPPTALGAVAREFWSYTWLRGVARVAQVGVQRLDVVLVAALLGPAEAAVYTAATRFVVLGQLVGQALQQVLQPRFTALLVEGDTAVLREVFRTGTAWTVVVTWPVHLVIGCFPAGYLSLFGGEYAGAGATAVVVVMSAAMLLASAAGAVDTLLLMAGRSGLSLLNGLVALAVDVVGCLLLVRPLGILGAALAWAAAVVVRNGLALVQVRRDLGVRPDGPAVRTAAVLALACVGAPTAAAALVVAAPAAPVVWPPTAVAVAVAYCLALRHRRAALRLDLLATALLPARGPAPGAGARAARLAAPHDAGPAPGPAPAPAPVPAPVPALAGRTAPDRPLDPRGS